MFWLFVVWTGAVVVVSMIISSATGAGPFPGGWGVGSRDEPPGPGGIPAKLGYAGRSP